VNVSYFYLDVFIDFKEGNMREMSTITVMEMGFAIGCSLS
jgi:hypothetical protein